MEKFLTTLPRIPIGKTSYKTLPKTSGVYIYWHKNKPIYVGKAIDLKSRLVSYLAVRLAPKTYRMMRRADGVSIIKVTSELEALLLEAELVRKFKPEYNVSLKDDKHPLYIRITKEKFPRVITARKIDASEPSLSFYGPFPSSRNVYSVLRMIRKIFPYSDHKLGKRACLYSHIGLCNPCPNTIKDDAEKKIYMENIRMIRLILGRKINILTKMLNKKMQGLSKNQRYERANDIKEKILKLNYITQARISPEDFFRNPNLLSDIRKKEAASLGRIISSYVQIKTLLRIECFDVAHIAGTNPTASMVTFINGEPEKSYYRHFKIRQEKGADDIASLAEVAKRRAKHFKLWGKPDLIIVDGGKAQVGVFYKIFSPYKIPIVGLAKRFKILVIPIYANGALRFKGVKLSEGGALNLVERLRDEAHRFARRYHHLLVRKNLLELS